MIGITKSAIHWKTILSQDVVNGRWVIEAGPDDIDNRPAGTLVCEPAPEGTDDSLCFTAPNGKRYMDTVDGSQWTPR